MRAFDLHERVDVTGLPADLIVSRDGVAFMERHHLSDLSRFHHWTGSDPQRDLHDHPWDYVTLIIAGGYREITNEGEAEYWAPTVLQRRAAEPHRVELLTPSVWTLMHTEPAWRRWGFHTPEGWVHWRDYDDAGHYADGDHRPTSPGPRRYEGAMGSRAW